MKKLACILPLTLLLLTGVSFCGIMPDASEPLQSNELVADIAAIDPIELEILDVEVMYWANRIVTTKDTSYAELEKLSQNWVIKGSTKKVFFSKLKELLDSGKARPLTPEENTKYEDGLARIRDILKNQGRKNKIRDDLRAVDALDNEIMDLNVMYWAARIVLDRDVTYNELEENSQDWVMMPLTKLKFLGKLRRMIASGKVRPLAVKEKRQLDKANEKIRRILAPGSADEKLISRYPIQECIEHHGKYWAWRIKIIKDVTAGEMRKNALSRWPEPFGIKVLDSMHRHLRDNDISSFKGTAADNKYKMDACIEKLKRYSQSDEYKKTLLKGTYSLTFGGKELSGDLVLENGSEKDLLLDGKIVKVKMFRMDETTLTVELAVYIKNASGELKLSARPRIVAVNGTQAVIELTGADKTTMKFKITPEKL